MAKKIKHDPINDLLGILSYKRATGTDSETEAIDKYLYTVGDVTEITTPDGKESLAFKLENLCEDGSISKTLFSCHTDTVHPMNVSGMNPIVYDANLGIVYKDGNKNADQTCLGADDGAGWWLMTQMFKAGVPGVYLFHRCEERGGKGSSGMAKHYPDWLKQFDRAVAFDRRGQSSVITHQGYGMCASQAFAAELATQLRTLGCDQMKPDDTGVFTDTANYTDLIAECTNISCGYEHEHSVAETLDVFFLQELLVACCSIDWESLPTVRKPGENDHKLSNDKWWNFGKDYDTFQTKLSQMKFSELVKWVKKTDPAMVAEAIDELLYEIHDLEDCLAGNAQTYYDNQQNSIDDDGDMYDHL